ncbi:MAG: hypothetical protein HYS98_04350 [Deltaproteobacteria bacterium]|nr:hypothetical protein [Deltaproteobacteria bacterium]
MKRLCGLFLLLTLTGAFAAELRELPTTYKEYDVTLDQGEKITLVATSGVYFDNYRKVV